MPPMSDQISESLYHYRAELVDIYDGDTLTCHIDLGFNTWLRDQKIRLYGIDTPELRGVERPEGLLVRDWLREQFTDPSFILLSHKDRSGKFGRWLGTILKDGRNLNEEMVDRGMAEEYLKD